MRVAIDIDGVLANFPAAYRTLVKEQTGIEIPEVPTCWDWDLPFIGQVGRQQVWGWLEAHPRWWQGVGVYDDTMTALKLMDQVGARHDLYFITHRPAGTKWHTERWLQCWGMEMPTVIVCQDVKWDVFKALGIEAAIEDNEANAVRCRNVGAEMTIVDRPYNQAWQGKRVVSALEWAREVL